MDDHSDLFLLRDLPRYEAIAEHAERYPEIEPASIEAYLVLLKVASELLGWRQRWLSERGMTQPQFNTLMLLDCDGSKEEGWPAPSELAERVGVTRATMTGVLDGLERESLVARRPDPADRRRQRVELTEAGRACLSSVAPAYFACIRGIMSGLSADRRRALSELLWIVGDRVPGRVSAVEPSPPAGAEELRS